MNVRNAVLALLIAAVLILCACEEDRFAANADDGVLTVYYFNVGQGDAALAVLNDVMILFDAGTNESEEKLAAYLDRLGIEKIDCMVLSHPHEDHIGGADLVAERFEVGCIVMPDSDSDDRCYLDLVDAVTAAGITVFEATSGDSFAFGELTLDVLAPFELTGDANLDSVIAKLTYGEASFLFTGDCEGEAETRLVEKAGNLLEADVLKVGHHGSNTATSEAFLECVRPVIAVISCGQDNDYGHPHSEVISRLDSHGVTVGRTDLGKSVTVSSDGKDVWVGSE